MLQWTTSDPGPRSALLVYHTDAQREWAYDRKSQIGALDKAWNEARAKGWTAVDMKHDWKKRYRRARAYLQATLRQQEAAGTTEDPACQEAMTVFYRLDWLTE
jgi:hypothetical protein